MPTYTIDQLREEGPQFAMALLLNCLSEGEPFVTYGAIKDEIQYQFGVDKIFPTQIGHVAGSLMDQILEIDPKAPLINALIARPDGIPGVGIGGYFAKRYRNPRLSNWQDVSDKKKRELVDQERDKVLRYKGWRDINDRLFGPDARAKLRVQIGTEQDGVPTPGFAFGGAAESEQHKRLKTWVSRNPDKIGVAKSFGQGTEEASLLSGDSVDVLFQNGTDFVTVEVKSVLSNDADFQRGIYQCVKYRCVKEAEHFPNQVNVRSILVTERKLPPDLALRAKILGVSLKVVSINKAGTRSAKDLPVPEEG